MRLVSFTRFWLSAVALALGPAAYAQSTINVTFQNATDINQFVVNHDGTAVPTSPGAGSNFNFNATAGVGGLGGLTTTNQDANANYVGPNYTGTAATATRFDLTQGATTSIFFKGPETAGDRPIQIGFLNQINNSFNNDPPATASAAYIGVRPYTNGRIELQVKSVNGGTVNSDFRPAATNLIANEWYKITFTTQETSPGNFSSSAILDDYGTTGTALVGNVFTSGTLTSTVTGFEVSNGNLLAQDGAGIAGFRQVLDNPNLSNFSVTGTIVPVPEPASLALCGLCAGGVMTWRRRK